MVLGALYNIVREINTTTDMSVNKAHADLFTLMTDKQESRGVFNNNS